MYSLRIEISDVFRLTNFVDADIPWLVDYLNSPKIYSHTLSIPSPYKKENAVEWISLSNFESEAFGRINNWAIRRNDETLVGGIGLMFTNKPVPPAEKTHRAEIGYWIAETCWNQQIATKAIQAVCQIGFKDFDLKKINAHVYDGNVASMRVLEKNGFEREGFLKAHFEKDGRLIDVVAFGLLRP